MNSQSQPFKLVRSKRLYELVAEQIEAMIREQQLAPGARLPAERELSELLGVSRPSLREAMIALETLGLVEVRVGEGTFVSQNPSSRGAISFIGEADLGPGPLEQFEARQAIEIACVRHAALRARLEHIEEMRQLIEEMEALVADLENPMALHRKFHELLATASGNLIFVKAVSDLWEMRQQRMWNLLRTKVENSESWRLGISMRHELVGRIAARDADGAATILTEHFERVGRMYFG